MTAATSSLDHAPVEWSSMRANLIAGTIAAVLLIGGFGVWASTTRFAGAVIAAGSLVVDSNVKKVQHLAGGIVASISVKDGDDVKAGDHLVRLDDTTLKANLAIVVKGLDDLTARKARLEAERDGLDDIDWPADLLARNALDEAAHAMAGERKLFEFRRTARQGQKTQLMERTQQLQHEIEGQLSLQSAKREEIELIERELDGVRSLWNKNLVQITRLTALERERARLKGELAQSQAAAAQLRGRVSEIGQQMLQIDQDLTREVGQELRDADSKIGELIERKVAAEDQLKRVDIRAPQAGTIHQLGVHTIGGVIGPGEVLMTIVPGTDRLAVEGKVAPTEIDQLHLGQSAALKFSAFNQRTTPEIEGTITRISADVSADQRSGVTFYTIRIEVRPEEIARLGGVRMVPGMPVEIFARTHDRTVLSFFVKPLQDQIARAFRER